MGYEIGQKILAEGSRAMMGAPLVAGDGKPDPRWYVLKVAAQREFDVKEWLKGEDGVLDAWLPTEKAWRILPRGKRRKAPYRKRIAPGYVFVCVSRVIAWDVLYQRANGKVIGVVGRDGEPLPVPEAQMRAMAKLPKTIKKLYAQKLEASRVRAGDKARIRGGTGAMCGWVVDVSEVNGGIAKVFLPLFGEREAEVSLESLERIQNIA